MNYEFETKEQMLEKINSWVTVPDSDIIRIKDIIKQELLKCPELLWALNDKSLERELFNDDGTLNIYGQWDKYFDSHVRPYIFFPEPQSHVANYVAYQVFHSSAPRGNSIEKKLNILFSVFVDGNDAMCKETGIQRHDMIGSMIRERFNWSNVFGLQTTLISDKEGTTDKNYITRTLVYEMTTPNGLVKTQSGVTTVINNRKR